MLGCGTWILPSTGVWRSDRTAPEDVIAATLERHGEPMSCESYPAADVRGKKLVFRSKRFDNVVRRTVSTSQRSKRMARGVPAL